jgi:hypothetical protein
VSASEWMPKRPRKSRSVSSSRPLWRNYLLRSCSMKASLPPPARMDILN